MWLISCFKHSLISYRDADDIEDTTIDQGPEFYFLYHSSAVNPDGKLSEEEEHKKVTELINYVDAGYQIPNCTILTQHQYDVIKAYIKDLKESYNK